MPIPDGVPPPLHHRLPHFLQRYREEPWQPAGPPARQQVGQQRLVGRGRWAVACHAQVAHLSEACRAACFEWCLAPCLLGITACHPLLLLCLQIPAGPQFRGPSPAARGSQWQPADRGRRRHGSSSSRSGGSRRPSRGASPFRWSSSSSSSSPRAAHSCGRWQPRQHRRQRHQQHRGSDRWQHDSASAGILLTGQPAQGHRGRALP